MLEQTTPATSAKTLTKARAERFHEIDGLRAVAILLVVSFHFFDSGLERVLRSHNLTRVGQVAGFSTRSGVELFFVLSGVVLLRPYLRHARKLNWKRYIARRVERLWPPYIAALVLAGTVIFLNSQFPSWYSQATLPHFALADWVRQVVVLNFGWQTYNVAWWSLTPEFLFYLLVPPFVALLLVARMTSRRYVALVLLAALVSLAMASRWGVPQPGRPAAETLRLFVAYTPCFLVGSAIAAVDFPIAVAKSAAACGIAWVGIALFWPVANIHLGFGAMYGGLVVLAMRGGGALRRSLSSPLLLWLGERSYSLFLTHFSVLYATNQLAAFAFPTRDIGYFLLSRGLGLPLSVIVAMVVFSSVEKRFARNLVTADAFWPWQLNRYQTAACQPHRIHGDADVMVPVAP